jgi:sialate O-acetylesterase
VKFALWLSIALLILPAAAEADVRLPHIFSDHMALQAGQDVPVWGWADPKEKVTVRFAGQTMRTRADASGHWRIDLSALKPDDAPQVMTVSGHNRIDIQDVVVGEVWLASGQSNMEKPIGDQRGQKPTFNAEAELADADHPDLRLFKIAKARKGAPADDVEGQWTRCDPHSLDATHFSAAGYFFGRSLMTNLHSAVGVIDSDWGGTRIEPWTPPEGFDAVPQLADFAAAEGSPVKVAGVHPSELYNGMIAPIVPYAIKGVIWYQGEENVMEVDDGDFYLPKMTALIAGWRKVWGYDMPFYYVQIAPFLYHLRWPETVVSPQAEPRLWEAQTAALSIPKTGMVVINDKVDDLFNIHPRDKKTVGERLANMALNLTYGHADIPIYGPMYAGVRFDGAQAIVAFDHADGLTTRDGKPPNWFVVAGKDGVVHPAQARISGDTVIVTSPDVSAPVAVRFAWDEASQPNLINGAGLPAAPFRSDNPLLQDRQP